MPRLSAASGVGIPTRLSSGTRRVRTTRLELQRSFTDPHLVEQAQVGPARGQPSPRLGVPSGSDVPTVAALSSGTQLGNAGLGAIHIFF